MWFSRHPDRLTATDIERLHPGPLAVLAAHPGIGFVVVQTDAGPVALGAQGTHDLVTGDVVGVDPFALFGPDAASDVLRVSSFPNAPDIYVNSSYDPVLDEVSAFEELVGCHGGLGGWQTRPLLVHPTDWPLDPDLLDDRGRLRGADVVHRQLVRWLERLGHRTDLPPDAVSGKAPRRARRLRWMTHSRRRFRRRRPPKRDARAELATRPADPRCRVPAGRPD